MATRIAVFFYKTRLYLGVRPEPHMVQCLARFLKMHDPRRSASCQYMSAVWPQDQEQQQIVEVMLKDFEERKGSCATQVMPPATFYRAEEYHQKYLEKGSGCLVQ
eukprot:TRINITY_DN3033_c0_g1_i4.p1 TRINITY_DN3033_c0_g1~~TRINITY_DN3033_c0_g1_i4.p1  ORF type:complete len:105 (-),score=10.98 TRINITY_DN3033_c0_g1_i4:372-686(-)